jgi:hypothetical protein
MHCAAQVLAYGVHVTSRRSDLSTSTRIRTVLLVAALMTEVLSAASGAQSRTLNEQADAAFTRRLPPISAAPACAIGETATAFPGGSEQFAVLDPKYRLPKGWKPAHLAWVNKSQQLQREGQ